MIIDLRNHQDVEGEDLKTVAYFQGKRIVEDTVGNLYFEIVPKSSLRLTDLLTMDRLTPIAELPKKEQADIRELLRQGKIQPQKETEKRFME